MECHRFPPGELGRPAWLDRGRRVRRARDGQDVRRTKGRFDVRMSGSLSSGRLEIALSLYDGHLVRRIFIAFSVAFFCRLFLSPFFDDG
jgi:hypothetical protein